MLWAVVAVTTWFAFLLPCQGWAFEPGDVSWRILGKAQGFRGGAVHRIIQDRRGLIWIGAAGGLFRYDGHSFTVLTPEADDEAFVSSSVNALQEDKAGDLWVGTDGGGLTRYRTLEDSFTNVALWTEKKGGSPSSRIAALALDEAGRIIAGTTEGFIYCVDPADNDVSVFFSPGSDHEAISSLLVDSQGRLWAGTDGGGLLRWSRDGTEFSRFTHLAGQDDSISSNRVRAVMEDSLGFIWVGFFDSGIDLVEGERFRHMQRDARGAGSLPGVLSLAEDTKGQIWAGLRGGGIGILDPSTMELANPSFADDTEVTALTRDRRGLMWIGLERGGLLTGDLKSVAFSRYSRSQSGKALGAVHSIAETSENKVIIAARNVGLCVFDQVSGSFMEMAGSDRDFDYRQVRAMLSASDGSLWFGSMGAGVLRLFPDGSEKIYGCGGLELHNPTSLSALCLAEGPDGKIWLGTAGEGLCVFDEKSGQFTRVTEPAASLGSIVTCLIKDSHGRIWAGTSDAGLSVLNPGENRFLPIGREKGGKDSIGDLRIESIFEDSRGVLWVGTGGSGLVALDPASGKILRRGRDMGLFAEAMYGFAEDAPGTLWICSSSGLFSLDTQREDFFLLGSEDGLLPGGLESGSIIVAKNGEVWIGSDEGLTRFDPAKVARYAPAPDVVISDVQGMAGNAALARSPDNTEISLGYNNMGLAFSIAVIDFAAPERNSYAMRLEGRQSSWTSMGNVNKGYLAPLPPGHYILRVKAANGNGVWNNYGASLSISIASPWWAAWWFRLFVVGLIAAAIGGIIAARVGSLRKRNALLVKFARHIDEAREEERKIAANDVHGEIGQHLMVLNFRAYWLATHPEASVDERLPVVKEIQRTILDAMASVKAVATRLRPAALDVLDFPDALYWYVQNFGKMSGISVKLQIGEGLSDLSKTHAMTFFQLLQEMLSNVARHAEASHVLVRFAREKDEFVLETQDNGKGIEATKIDAQDSFGIIGMRERCVSSGGSLTIFSVPGDGCVVTAKLPVAAHNTGVWAADAETNSFFRLFGKTAKAQRGKKTC